MYNRQYTTGYYNMRGGAHWTAAAAVAQGGADGRPQATWRAAPPPPQAPRRAAPPYTYTFIIQEDDPLIVELYAKFESERLSPNSEYARAKKRRLQLWPLRHEEAAAARGTSWRDPS